MSNPTTQTPTSTAAVPPRSVSEISIVDEVKLLESRVNEKVLPEELKLKAKGMILRLKKMSAEGSFSKEFEPVSEYINWLIKIPFGKVNQDNLDLDNALTILNANHYGLDKVKERILEYLAVLQLKAKQSGIAHKISDPNLSTETDMKKLRGNSANAPVLCFVGIQGVGKTTMAKSIANALGREFIRISLGALGGVTDIRGRSRGEIDAEPGQIIKALVRTESMNPLILLDEVDKVSSQTGLRADVMAALLEILDPEQNATFMDKYLDYPINLSQCVFITTAIILEESRLR